MKRNLASGTVLVLLLAAAAVAADYRAEALDEGPPTDEISKEVADQLQPHGFRVIRGAKTTLCDIWLRKEVPGTAVGEGKPDIIYPFKPGEIFGVARFSRKSSDFRDQEISKGVYTLRCMLQPVDGAHVGTSPTRDFVLLVAAEMDKSLAPIEYKTLVHESAEVAGSSHPALLSLQRVQGEEKPLSMRHDEERDWWIMRLPAKVSIDGKGKDLPVDLVIQGVAAQ